MVLTSINGESSASIDYWWWTTVDIAQNASVNFHLLQRMPSKSPKWLENIIFPHVYLNLQFTLKESQNLIKCFKNMSRSCSKVGKIHDLCGNRNSHWLFSLMEEIRKTRTFPQDPDSLFDYKIRQRDGHKNIRKICAKTFIDWNWIEITR